MTSEAGIQYSDSEFSRLLSDEEGESYNFQELLDALTENRDIILTIPKDQVEALRKGLSVAKAKRNAKLKSAGLAAPTDTITYLVYEDKMLEGSGDVRIRVKLGARIGINVKKLELPDDEL